MKLLPRQTEHKQALAEAERNWQIAAVILGDHPGGGREAWIHVVRGWQALSRTADSPVGRQDEQWSWLERLAMLPLSSHGAAMTRQEWFAELSMSAASGWEDGPLPELPRIKAHIDQLEDAVFDLRRLYLGTPRSSAAWWISALLMLAGAILILQWVDSLYVWKSELFYNAALEGSPQKVGRAIVPAVENDIEIPFSKRWDTCFYLAAPGRVSLQTVSDDGSRVFVNGRLVLDNWKDQPAAPHEAAVVLASGWHHLRLEYYQRKGNVFFWFQAWIEQGGEVDMLTGKDCRYPGADADGGPACAVHN